VIRVAPSEARASAIRQHFNNGELDALVRLLAE
jgi:hypothetical protein